MSTNILEIDGLSKRFGSVVTADRLTFAVEAGEALGVIGPNGAGKSTLLSLITGVLRPDDGRVTFAGADLTDVSTARRTRAGIARTFQIPRPFTDMTVFENALVGASYGAGERGRGAATLAVEALDRTKLLHLADTRAGDLRLLDRKRLELARALATRPRLVLLDEIAGGLNDHELPALVGLIRELKESGLTIIWIEHIVHALTAVVDELMCLAFGRILAQGTPANVMHAPEVVETYLGTTFTTGEESG
ncbi:MAG: ABC transporter ATP-binding protein [Tistrella sp.]|uniref:ABC transporter ATP-binding protein n=1 Tax=Microbacteriaceae TaxID=85023 RepID=UPI0008DA003C|nr:ABC transporter ATP-binding protein [Microcella indica]MBA74066.1 ABC transporter ATP-binding protein [Tistrella sp.]